MMGWQVSVASSNGFAMLLSCFCVVLQQDYFSQNVRNCQILLYIAKSMLSFIAVLEKSLRTLMHGVALCKYIRSLSQHQKNVCLLIDQIDLTVSGVNVSLVACRVPGTRMLEYQGVWFFLTPSHLCVSVVTVQWRRLAVGGGAVSTTFAGDSPRLKSFNWILAESNK